MKKEHKSGFYEKYFKRVLDIACSFLFLTIFWWLYLIIAILVRVKLGSPVLFKQPRPGKDEKIFYLYKFRTMTDEKDSEGNPLPDEVRMTKFGAFMRSLSIDELPEVWLIFIGQMSILGPRPLLVRDLVYMNENHRKRHTVRPGLSGLAQVMGRNDIDWEDKLDLDIKYVNNITFWGDVKLLFMTIFKVFKREGITEGDMATAADYGDYLLKKGRISKEEYDKKQMQAKEMLLKK
ncbi:MAG: sugar transferase [Clostridiales bacterium]|nr:sugar transferase [Clostridiales bacterium]